MAPGLSQKLLQPNVPKAICGQRYGEEDTLPVLRVLRFPACPGEATGLELYSSLALRYEVRLQKEGASSEPYLMDQWRNEHGRRQTQLQT